MTLEEKLAQIVGYWLDQNGVVAPIELGDKAAEFETVALQAFTSEGQVYGVPYAIENIGLIRNTKLAAEAPATWDDAVAAGKKAGTKYPILLQVGETGDPYTMYPLQTSFGAAVFTQNSDGSYSSELAMGGDNGAKFAQWLAEQGKAGTLDTAITYDIAVDAFAKGKSPFIIGGPWMLEKFADLDLSIDPIPSAGGQTASPFVGVQGFFISAQSKNAIVANVASIEAREPALAFRPSTCRFIQNRPRLRETYIQQAYIKLIERARREVLIANAYFVPTPSLAQALTDAARRCVPVKLISNSPETNDLPEISLVGRGHLLIGIIGCSV